MPQTRPKIAQAYEKAKPARDELCKLGRCMEVTEDKCGILWERWLVGPTQIIVFATPHYVELFMPLTDDPTWLGTFAALKEKAAMGDVTAA